MGVRLRFGSVVAATLVAMALAPVIPAAAQTPDDERAIGALIEAHAVAWKARDIRGASAVYSDNATIAFGSGRVLTGRAGSDQWHTEALTAPVPSTHTHPPDTLRVHFLGPNVAVADVESHSPGPANADGTPGPTRKSPLFVVLIKTGDGWRVAAQRPTTLSVK